MAREIRTDQNYYDKLLKLIPGEIVAAYLIITGIIPYSASKIGNIIVFLIILIIIPFYLWRAQNVKNKLQITVTTIAFLVWVYSFNIGPFSYLKLYKPWIASIILILWTVIVPILIVPEKVELKKDNNIDNKTRKIKTVKKNIKK